MNAVAMRWNDWPITRKSLAVVTLPLLLLAVALMAIYSVERQNIAAENDVRQTLEVLSDLYEAHALLAETAAGVRGYRLVRRDEFLTPYRDAEPRLQRVVDRLSQRITDPTQAQRFAHIKPLFAEKMQGWRRLLAPDLSREEEIRQLWDGKYKLDILRAELRELRNYETAQLQARTAKAQGLRQRNLIITLNAAMRGGLGAVFAVAWFASALSGRLRTLAANADRLGEGLPLAPQPRADDELGQVGQRLAQASELLAARAAEAQLARREAETANRAKTEFLSRSSHELRTPLNAILGYAQVLEMDLPEPGHRRHLQHILGAGRHLLGLITELLDIARIEADQLDLNPEPISVRAAVHEALGLIAPDADKYGITLRPSSIDGPWTVRADAQRLRQVLLNLLSNAVKFNRTGGQVQVSAQADGEQVRITVADQGAGLTPAQIERLFTPFERLGAERSAVEGTGLGLALSKRLIEAMGGQIGVDSSSDGARFWISLPQGEHQHSEPTRPLLPPSNAGSGMCRLLSIEDNPSNQALIRTLTERRPQWQLLEAASLAQARELLQHGAPDLILLDLHLSDGNGEELLRELQAQPATAAIPVVVISADATTATLARVGNQDVRAYLTKPLDVAEFFHCNRQVAGMTRDEILGSRILIVDDEPANVRLLEDLLQREGFQQVIATTDPLRVMGLVSAFAPDLILLDLKMPELDGYALLEQLARLSDPGQFLPVIVLTADPSRSARHHALGLGAKDFLTKPLDTFEVALRVWNVAETTVLFKRLRALAAPDAAPPGWRQQS